MTSKSVSPDEVTAQEFSELLDQYDPLIESISAAKGGELPLSPFILGPWPHCPEGSVTYTECPAKPGQKSLKELDHFRYVDAPRLFSQATPEKVMDHEDVKILVDWKL